MQATINMYRADFEEYARSRLKAGFGRYIKIFLEEAEIDLEEIIEVEGSSGINLIPVGVLINAMIAAPEREQQAIKHTIIRLDFANAPIRPYLVHLARAIAR